MDLVRLDATTAGGAELRSALLASSEWLDGHAARIDALNVFPVPDGDTGTEYVADAAGSRRRAP